MSFKIDGLDKLQKQLKQMEKGAKELEKTKHIPFEELFTKSFMAKYTDFSSFDDLLTSGGFEVNSQDDFLAIPDDVFDNHISSVTRFNNWESMLNKATDLYVSKKLGF